MSGLLGMFAKAPKIKDRIVFSEGRMQEVVEHTEIAHGVTGERTYYPYGDQYICRRTTLYRKKEEILSGEQLPFLLREVFEAETLDNVRVILVKHRRLDCYQLVNGG